MATRATAILGVTLCSMASAACAEDEAQRTLPPVQLALDHGLEPLYDDGELTLFEVRRAVQFPIVAPTEAELRALAMSPVPPFARQPWVTLDDVRVQLTWTLTNLDDEARTVEVLIDPWNEFARYSPGFMVVNAQRGEVLPNLSGIDFLYRLEGKGSGAPSRRFGTYTFDDMDELARDFATVQNLASSPPPPLGETEGNGALMYANHAFATQNHSARDPLVANWLPRVIPALTGFDLGLRTEASAKVAIEVVVELVDRGAEKVRGEGDDGPLLAPPATVLTLGAAEL